jgi:hypothetical protein
MLLQLQAVPLLVAARQVGSASAVTVALGSWSRAAQRAGQLPPHRQGRCLLQSQLVRQRLSPPRHLPLQLRLPHGQRPHQCLQLRLRLHRSPP